jgi:hypothetical protein
MEGVGLGATGETARTEFGAYFAEHHRDVGMLAYRLCGERAVAEEVTADAFAEAWRCWDELTRTGAPQPEAMRGIVQRLVEGRAHAAGRTQTPEAAGEPDGARVRALLAERITLIPPQDAPTVLIPRIVVEPVEQSVPDAPAARFPRPVVISAVITAGAIVVLGAVAMAASNGGGTTQANQAPLSLAATGSLGAVATGSLTSAGTTSASASRSASASPSHSPSPSPTASTHSASASPTGAASSAAHSTATANASTAATASGALTASPSVNHGSNGSWSQLDVAATINQPLSALTITITVADCAGLSPAGAWDSGAGGEFTETTTVNADGSISYVFALNSGNEATPGDVTFAAQFSHTFHSWTASADTYSVAAVVASSGATDSFGGGF